MPRISHLAAACALALCAQAAQAQQFSNVISFGDSLTDAGNTTTVDGNPATFAGNSFTTNNDPVHAQIIAAYYGYNQTESALGGYNFAFGGSCAQTATASRRKLASRRRIAQVAGLARSASAISASRKPGGSFSFCVCGHFSGAWL